MFLKYLLLTFFTFWGAISLHANDSCTSPTATITLNDTLTGQNIQYPYISGDASSGKALYYKIILTQNGQLQLRTQTDSTHASDTVNTYGQLMDSTCALLTTDTQTASDPRYFTIDQNLSAGTYYLRVYNEVVINDSDPSLAKGYFQLYNSFTAALAETGSYIWRSTTPSGYTVTSGEDIVFHVYLKNTGTSSLTSATITIPDFSNLTYIGTENDSEWSCTKNSTNLSCTLNRAPLAHMELSSFDIRYHAPYSSNDITESNQASANVTYANGTSETKYDTKNVLIKKITPSIKITKTASQSSVIQGDSFDYTLTVKNNGTIDADSISVSDTVPSAYTVTGVSDGDFSCNVSGQQIDCTLPGTLYPNGAEDLTIHVTATGSSGAINTASVSAVTAIQNVSDNDYLQVDIVPQTYELSLLHSIDTSELIQGHTTYYYFSIRNTGNMDLSHVTLTDTIPSQLSIVNITAPADWDCSASDTTNNQLSCTLPAVLAPGDVKYVSVKVKGETTGTGIVNSATATADSAATKNADTTLDIVAPQPSIDLEKSAPSSVKSLKTFYYTFTAENSGTETLSNITLTDTFDAQLTLPADWNDAVPASWHCNKSGNTLTCTYMSTLAPGDTTQILDIKVKAPYTTTDTLISNTAQVDANYTTSATVSDTDNADVTISRIVTGVALVKSVSPSNVHAGDTFAYTVRASNSGTVEENNVTIIDDLPAELGDSFTVNAGTFDCSASHGRHVECTLASLAENANSAITITFTAPVVSSTTTVRNDANVSAHITAEGNTDETVTSTGYADVTIEPPLSVLSVSKTASQTTVLEKDIFTYTVSVSNNGLGMEDNITITDVIPSDLTIQSIDSGSWSCLQNHQKVDCLLSSLAPGSDADPVKITVQAPNNITTDKTVTNTATVKSVQNSTGVSDTADVQLLSNYSAINLHLISSPSSVFAGDPYSYSIKVTNNSGRDIATVTLTDTLPNDVVYDHTDNNGWNCNYTESNRTLSCDNNGTAFPPGDHTITLYVKAPNYETNVTNTVFMKSSIITQDRNASTVTYVRGRDTHLQFSKALASKNPVKMNEPYSYIFEVTNLADTPDSDVNATDLNVTILLDQNETKQALHATGWTCTGDQNITCTLPWLAQHEVSPQIVIDVVSPSYGQRITNVSAKASESRHDLNTTLITTVKEIVQADAVLEVSDTPDPVESGDSYTYDFTVTNTHPTKTLEGMVVDINTTSAENFVLQSYDDSSLWNCQQNSDNVHCQLNSTIPPNSDIHLKLDVLSPAVATNVEINATLSSEYLNDTNPDNNNVHESTTVHKTDFTVNTPRDFTRVPIQGDEDTNIYGDILSIGNQSVCEQNSVGQCIEPTYPVNDIIEQKNINLDSAHAGAYKNATAARLNLQPNDEVIWAGLYWMGRIDKTKSGVSEKIHKAATVYLRHETEGSYMEIRSDRSANAIDNNGTLITGVDKFNFINDSSYFDYQGMADVTNYVRQHKGGYYWVADVQVTEGDNISAGWNLLVIVMDKSENPTRDLRNITVFDGFQGVWKSPDYITDNYPDEVNETVKGFLTPAYGAIDSKVYMFAFEGDKTLDDYITITDKGGTPHQLTNSINPVHDVVNGTLSHTGTLFTDRIPALHNSSGIDIDSFALGDVNGSGIIQNDQTSTSITIGSGDGTASTTGGDQFFLGLVAFSTNLHQPLCYTQSYKTTDFSADLPAEISLGQEIGIDVEIVNTEVQDVDNLKIYTAIDPILKENNSSFEIKNIDSAGTPESNFHSAGSLFDFGSIPMTPDQNQTEITVRAGYGADSSNGGKLYGNKKLYFRYKAIIDDFNDENKTLNVYKISYNPINKKIMMPSCGTQTHLPVIKANHTNGFNTVHQGGMTDTMLDGLTHGDPTAPNNETHLFTQLTGNTFQVDVVALDDDNPQMIRPNPYHGLVELELVEYNSSLSCESYQPIKKLDVSFNGAVTATQSLSTSDAQQNTLFRVRYLTDKYGKMLEWSSNSLTISNLVNILHNSGMTNICTAECTGMGATLTGCKTCLFKRIEDGGLAKVSCSSDTFTIKPATVTMDINTTAPLVGGKSYNLDFDANTTQYNPTVTSGNGALDYQLVIPSGCTIPPASGSLLTSSLNFSAGKATLSGFKYPNVGKIKVDYRDSVWTYYDQNATDANMSDCIVGSSSNTPDASGRIGCDVSGSKVFTFVPANFTSTAAFAPSAGSHVYISNDPAMSGILNLSLSAKLQDNSIATNYTQGCFANDVNFTLSVANTPEDWNGRADINTSVLFDGSGSTPQHLGGGSFKIPQSLFNSGMASNIPVKINYQRKRSVPQDPFTVHKNDFNLTVVDDDNVTGGDFDKSSDQSVQYLYARVYATTIKTDENSIDVPLYYEAYCKDCNRSKYFPANVHEGLDSVNWYRINTLHTSAAQGHIQSIFAKNGTQIGTVTLDKIPLSLGTLNAPHRDRIFFKPDAWLQFNKYKETEDKSHFDVFFFPPDEKWGGKGDIGRTIDLNISKTNRQTIDW